jgi:hypothetical protein
MTAKGLPLVHDDLVERAPSLTGVFNAAGVPVLPFLPQTLTATISNNQSIMALSKYAVGPLKLYGG